ncbi:MAG: DHA2 family efflux MFS transporter permease subunit [Pseudomonadota bacterium]
MSAAQTPANVEPLPSAGFRTWLGFAALCLGMFMAILDIQIVVTSLPTISAGLGIQDDRISWIQTSYLIAEVIAIPLTGLLTRALGIRNLFVIALSVFVVASLMCAMATGFWSLILARVVQGFAGGCLIPLVFSSVFLLFSDKQRGLATTLAGALAVLAPTLGPTVGGYITETYSWHWLFLVNIAPGLLALLVAFIAIPRGSQDIKLLRHLDLWSLLSLAIALATLEIMLKEAPARGWQSPVSIGLLIICSSSMWWFINRSIHLSVPVCNLKMFKDVRFSVACILSFVFGMALFASVYLMPVFLGLVRKFGALEIGLIMVVTGLAQLLVAPAIVQLDLRVRPHILSAVGLVIFAIGLAMSGWQTRETGFDEMFWPQVVRGVGIMLCLIPPTRLALDHLQLASVPDGSALFNLMRNLGGAVGIAIVDTILWQRAPIHAEQFGQRLLQHDLEAAKLVGVPIGMLPPIGTPPTEKQLELGRPLVERAGLVEAINEAWLFLSVSTLAAVLVLLLLVIAPGSQRAQ